MDTISLHVNIDTIFEWRVERLVMDKALEWLHEKENEQGAGKDIPQPLGKMTWSGEDDLLTSTPLLQIVRHLQVVICF